MSDPHVPLGWGIVGPGRIASVFAACIQKGNVGRVASATGRSAERARTFCEKHGGRAAETLDVLLHDEAVDAVYVATPHPMHAKAVEAALRAGKAVLCEKPMTTSAPETARLVELSRETGSPLVEAWMYRCHPQIATARDRVRQGAIGSLRTIESAFGFVGSPERDKRLFDPTLGGGAILDVGGYPVSLAMFLAADEGHFAEPRITEVSGELTDSGVDAWAEATLDFGGVESRVRTAITRDLGMTAVAEGDAGRLEFENPFMPSGERDGRTACLIMTSNGLSPARDCLVDDLDCFSAEAQAVARLVRGGGVEAPPPMVGHAESIAISRILDEWRTRLHGLAASPGS